MGRRRPIASLLSAVALASVSLTLLGLSPVPVRTNAGAPDKPTASKASETEGSLTDASRRRRPKLDVIVLDAGRIVEQGTHRELLALNGAYAQMWALQQQEEEREHLPPGARQAVA